MPVAGSQGVMRLLGRASQQHHLFRPAILRRGSNKACDGRVSALNRNGTKKRDTERWWRLSRNHPAHPDMGVGEKGNSLLPA